MKKFIKFFCMICLLFSVCTNLSATIKVKKSGISSSKKISVTSFIDYPPFGVKGEFGLDIDTVYKPLIDLYNEKSPVPMIYYVSDNYSELLEKVVDGKIDILLGAYYDTALYNGIELIYPSILNNPLVLVTMPGNTLNIKKRTTCPYKNIDTKQIPKNANPNANASRFGRIKDQIPEDNFRPILRISLRSFPVVLLLPPLSSLKQQSNFHKGARPLPCV